MCSSRERRRRQGGADRQILELNERTNVCELFPLALHLEGCLGQSQQQQLVLCGISRGIPRQEEPVVIRRPLPRRELGGRAGGVLFIQQIK